MDVPSKCFDMTNHRHFLQEMRKQWYESSPNSPFVLGSKFTSSTETIEAFSIWFVFQKYVFKS
jgi:hypothetical protein